MAAPSFLSPETQVPSTGPLYQVDYKQGCISHTKNDTAFSKFSRRDVSISIIIFWMTGWKNSYSFSKECGILLKTVSAFNVRSQEFLKYTW